MPSSHHQQQLLRFGGSVDKYYTTTATRRMKWNSPELSWSWEPLRLRYRQLLRSFDDGHTRCILIAGEVDDDDATQHRTRDKPRDYLLQRRRRRTADRGAEVAVGLVRVGDQGLHAQWPMRVDRHLRHSRGRTFDTPEAAALTTTRTRPPTPCAARPQCSTSPWSTFKSRCGRWGSASTQGARRCWR